MRALCILTANHVLCGCHADKYIRQLAVIRDLLEVPFMCQLTELCACSNQLPGTAPHITKQKTSN